VTADEQLRPDRGRLMTARQFCEYACIRGCGLPKGFTLRGVIRGTLCSVAALALAGCVPAPGPTPARETVTVTAGQESSAAPAQEGVYFGNGVWSVGDQPSGGAQRFIPPGRYTVTISGNVQIGTWIRCSAVVDCALNSPHQIDIQNAIGPNYSGVTEIQRSDAAIWLQNVTLTRVP
jgi:hypothetical protein